MTQRRVKVLVRPTSEPLTLEEAKSHLRVDFGDDDAYITSLIKVARDFAEGFQKKSIGQYTLEQYQSCFTTPIKLEQGPVKSVTSVKYYLEDGTEMTVDPSVYMLTVDGKLLPKRPSNYWPMDILQPADGVKITYVAGEDNVPETTKQAMLLLIGNWYENREPVSVGKAVAKIPLTAESLLWMGMRG